MDRLLELFDKLKLERAESGAIDGNTVEEILVALRSKREPFDEKALKNVQELFVVLIQVDTPETKAKVLQMIAEIAKSEETRVPLVEAGLLAVILPNLESEDGNVVLQSLRAIGNISCDNEQAKLALFEGKGAEKIVKKLEFLEKAFDEQSDNRVEFVACGSMLNIVSDNDVLAEEAVSYGAISFLLGFAKQSIHSNPSLCRMAVSAVSHLSSVDKAKAIWCETDGLSTLMKVLQESDDEELSSLVFETLSPLMTDDNIKKSMVQLGCAQNLANIVASCRNQLQDETVQFKLQSAADIIVLLLTEDESMNVLFGAGNGIVLKECVSWLSSGDAHLEVSGALALGNFARTDDNCIILVEQGVHKQLLLLLGQTLRKENVSRQQQAVFSALKNLSMPAVNKPVLVESGCLDVILPLLSSQSPFVQFKVLGTLRMLLMGQSMVANRIAGSNEHLKTIVRCSQTSGHEGVKSEASRLLALLAKQGRSAEMSQKIMKCGGLAPIVAMVASHHDIMQNEALIALAAMSSMVGEECHSLFRESGVIQMLTKMIKIQGTAKCSPQTCYNCMAVLESFSLREYFRRDLEVAGFSKALDDLTSHENETVKKRALIILTRIKAQKLM